MANKITINPKKSLALIISPKITTPNPDIQLHFNNNSVTLEDSVKYLGITIDPRLNFDVNINTLAGKISRSLGVITKLKQIFPRKTFRSLYYTTIHPYLLYGTTLWGNTYVTQLKRLKSLQNKAVKIFAGGLYLDDSAACYKQLNILKIGDLYTLKVGKLMHKFYWNKLSNRFFSFFTPVTMIHPQTTRLASSNLNLYIPLYQIVKLQRFFTFWVVSIWNSVPQDMKILSFDSFKIQFKQHLMFNYQ